MLVQLAALAQVETGSVATTTSAAVRADEAHGYRVAPEDDKDPGRMLLRGLLFLPRAFTTIVFAPIRGLLWLVEEYEIPEFLVDVFYNDERTFGVFPSVFVESGFGVGGGARMVVRDVLAEDTRFNLSAGYGGRFRQFYRGELTTGQLITDWLELGVEGGYQERPKDYHFGIGAQAGSDEVRIHRRRVQGIGFARFRPTDFMRITGSGMYARWNIENSPEDPNVDLSIFRPEYDLAYEELFVELDTRRPAHHMIPQATPSHGFYLGASGGYTQILTAPNSQYWRWSADGQVLLDLYHGNRTLMFRTYLEGVTGRLDEIPLVELPSLGGPHLLRGYERDRFRDRTLTMVSAEYRFPVAAHALGYIFVDGGRVFRTLEEFSFNDWRVGFGGGFDLYTKSEQLVRLQAAGSKDGDFIMSVVLGADFDHEPRSER